jgi:ribonuclease VapC
MIVDTSAIIASIYGESQGDEIGRHIGEAAVCRIGTPSLVEASMVLIGREGERGGSMLASFLQHRLFDIVSFSDAHWRVAQSAFGRYGKGRHPAGLNFGDCLTYAVASVAGEPLLCVGKDFMQTDLELVLD